MGFFYARLRPSSRSAWIGLATAAIPRELSTCPMTIDRCLCFARPFAELAEVAHATGAETVAELQAHMTFGQKCRLCHPYVRRMLRTGETVFHEIVTEADEPKVGVCQPEGRNELATTTEGPTSSPAR